MRKKIRVGAGTLLDLSSFKNKVGVLEAELLALEFTEMRTLARVAAGGDPGPESAILKLKGTGNSAAHHRVKPGSRRGLCSALGG